MWGNFLGLGKGPKPQHDHNQNGACKRSREDLCQWIADRWQPGEDWLGRLFRQRQHDPGADGQRKNTDGPD